MAYTGYNLYFNFIFPMKKNIWISVLTLALINTTFADVKTFLVDVSPKKEYSQDESFYISVFATDSQGLQVSTLSPFAASNDLVEVWKFYNCASAEGRDVCGKFDSSFVGLPGWYVAKAKANKEGTTSITVFSDAQKWTSWVFKNITIASNNKIVPEEPKEEVTTLEKAPVTWSEIQWGQYILLSLILITLLIAFGKANGRRVVYSTRNK